MKTVSKLFAVIALMLALPLCVVVSTAYGLEQLTKFDSECTGKETVGRCADKCPDGSYLIAYDKNDGSAICKANPTGCPYGDSIPLGDECNRAAQQDGNDPNIPDAQNDTLDYAPPINDSFRGK